MDLLIGNGKKGPKWKLARMYVFRTGWWEKRFKKLIIWKIDFVKTLKNFLLGPDEYPNLPISKIPRSWSWLIVSAIFWGISGHFRPGSLRKKVDPAWLVCWRLYWAGVILLIFFTFRSSKRHFSKSGKKPIDGTQIFPFLVFSVWLPSIQLISTGFLFQMPVPLRLHYLGPVHRGSLLCRQKNRRCPLWLNISHLDLALAGDMPFAWPIGKFWHLGWFTLKAFLWGITFRAAALAFFTPLYILQGILRQISLQATVTGWAMFLGGFKLCAKSWNTWRSGIWDVQDLSLLLDMIILFRNSDSLFYYFLSSVVLLDATLYASSCYVSDRGIRRCKEPQFSYGLEFILGLMDWIGNAFYFGCTVTLLT